MTLTLTNCAKSYVPGVPALHPTSLDIGGGEIVSLLGPSGCGKTTLLRVVAGLETCDPGGRVVFSGQDVTDVPVERRRIGMVFQNYALFPNMTVDGNVAYGLRMQKLPKGEIEARVGEVLELCQLQKLRRRPVTALSGGQRQRVALARAVAPRPQLLLLDEPLSALDAALRERLRDELAMLLRSFGITSVFVTHDQNEALAISDRIAVMHEGRVQQMGAPEDLYHRPANAFVAGFVGSAQCLDGRPEGEALLLPGGLLPVGQSVAGRTVWVRAENVRVDPEGPLSGRVEAATFLGDHTRLAISGVVSGLLAARHPGPGGPRPGDVVRIQIRPESLLLLEAAA